LKGRRKKEVGKFVNLSTISRLTIRIETTCKVVSIHCSRSPGAGWHGSFYKGIAYKEGEGVNFGGDEK
jgi:hypothetical protein